jgi:hypothetical protein
MRVDEKLECERREVTCLGVRVKWCMQRCMSELGKF